MGDVIQLRKPNLRDALRAVVEEGAETQEPRLLTSEALALALHTVRQRENRGDLTGDEEVLVFINGNRFVSAFTTSKDPKKLIAEIGKKPKVINFL